MESYVLCPLELDGVTESNMDPSTLQYINIRPEYKCAVQVWPLGMLKCLMSHKHIISLKKKCGPSKLCYELTKKRTIVLFDVSAENTYCMLKFNSHPILKKLRNIFDHELNDDEN